MALDLADHAYLIETGRMVLSGSADDQAQRRGAGVLPRLLSMDTFLHQVLAGLATGGIYASVALALVMIYQATHLVNFAQGEMAMFSTYIAWALINAGRALLGGVLPDHRPFVRARHADRTHPHPPDRAAPVLPLVVVFIGLLVIFNSVAGWIFTYTIKAFPSPFPKEPLFGQKYLSSHELGAIGVTLVVLACCSTCSSASRRSASRCARPRRTRRRAGWSASASAGCWRSAGAGRGDRRGRRA